VRSGEAFLDSLWRQEPESIVKGLASLTFLRSQGRTLAKGSQITFLDIAWRVLVPALTTIATREEFDHAHKAWVETLLSKLSTNRRERLTYGQGQKSLNVFLKFYVDWASLPDNETASRLRPWLHCPLDKVVMDGLSRTFPETYRTHVRPKTGSSPQRFSLSHMTEESYRAWQKWIRELSPAKPVLVDVSWALERAVSGES
jgi:hypothetical protein